MTLSLDGTFLNLLPAAGYICGAAEISLRANEAVLHLLGYAMTVLQDEGR